MINVLRDLLNADKSVDDNSAFQPATPKRYSYVTIDDIVKIYPKFGENTLASLGGGMNRLLTQ